jgi:hypothetical protein
MPEDISPRQLAAIEYDIRKKAKRRVFARVGLTWHAVVFAMANLAMYAINQRYSPGVAWFVWPLAGWGAALGLHAFATLSGGPMTEGMIQAEITRERQRRGLA